MIRYVQGDLLQSKAEVLVNPVNCVGVMGAGLAAKFKEKFPDYFRSYENACSHNRVRLGECRVYFCWDLKRWFFSFPTKGHWRDKSELSRIDSGLLDLRNRLLHMEKRSVALPALGCGLGGLSWADVKPLIEKHLGDLDCDVEVYPPRGMS